MTPFDEFWHMTEEKRQQQCFYVGTIDIRICHDNNAVVSQFIRIKFITTNTAAQRRNQRTDLHRGQHLVKPGFLDVKNFSLQRKDGLVLPVAPLFGRTARRITLHQVYLRLCRVLLLTICQLPR